MIRSDEMPILEMNINDGTVVRWPLFLSWIIDYLFRFPFSFVHD